MSKIKNCEEIRDEIFKMLDNYIYKLKKFAKKPSFLYDKEKEHLLNEISLLKLNSENEYIKNEHFVNEITKLTNYIKEDTLAYEKELQLIAEKVPILKEKAFCIDQLNEELKRITSKHNILNVKFIEREKEDAIWKEKAVRQANNFRKYLGINIAPEVKHVLRVTFYLQEECFFLINFENNPKIIDIFPFIISVEEAQVEYEKLNDFYEFCKFIRKIFRKI
ncbi:chromosome segregation Spc25 [Tubulinosema ratisbonensis]|uniref:Chromosome segregation Spc25 n=1 Tax=Tubulinosema ratisbonensis TaxID=291195 RepID=A0A437APY4_9MICR|nr:chromosome segregation Spc25 [Tubulinosema ratisbonensis]